MEINDWEKVLESGDMPLVANEGHQITKDEANDLFLKYFTLQQQADIFKMELEKAMVSNGIRKWETDDFIVRLSENKPSRRLDKNKLKATIEGYLGESLDNYYTESKVEKQFKLTIIDKEKQERRSR